MPAVSGDASNPGVLIQAHIARAGMLVIATPDTFNVRKTVETARTLNPHFEVVVRTHSEDEAALLRKENIGPLQVQRVARRRRTIGQARPLRFWTFLREGPAAAS